MGKLAAHLVVEVDKNLKFGVQVKENMQTEKLSGVFGGVYKVCDKTNVKAKINQNLKTSLSIKHKLSSKITAILGLQLNKEACPFVKGKACPLPIGLSFDVSI